jgi:nucleoside-diphosphate-sugar epimerase
MRALVTGAGGFLGEAIARSLVARGDEVRGLARGDYPGLVAAGVAMQQGDVADEASVDRAVRGCDVIFHVAAKAGVWGDVADYHRSNVLGTQLLLAAARRHGVPRFVYTSSPSVVFPGGPLRGVDESIPYPSSYSTHYPRTKAIAERAVLGANDAALRTVSLRPHLIWGPGDRHLVPRIVARARAGQLRLVGQGEARIDTTYIDDAARAHLLAAEALDRGAAAGKAYFITQGAPIAVGTLVNRILAEAGLPPVSRFVPLGIARTAGAAVELVYRLGRLRGEPRLTRFLAEQLAHDHYFSIEAARRDLGYEPRTTIDEGLARLGVWLRSPEGLAATGG